MKSIWTTISMMLSSLGLSICWFMESNRKFIYL